jgi:hypothetical protein
MVGYIWYDYATVIFSRFFYALEIYVAVVTLV